MTARTVVRNPQYIVIKKLNTQLLILSMDTGSKTSISVNCSSEIPVATAKLHGNITRKTTVISGIERKSLEVTKIRRNSSEENIKCYIAQKSVKTFTARTCLGFQHRQGLFRFIRSFDFFLIHPPNPTNKYHKYIS
jgi:hypothetical protein